jgi:hypothetical protein
MPFLNRLVSNAANWVPTPEKGPLSIGIRSFFEKQVVLCYKAKFEKLSIFRRHIFSNFDFLREEKNRPTNIFSRKM